MRSNPPPPPFERCNDCTTNNWIGDDNKEWRCLCPEALNAWVSEGMKWANELVRMARENR